VFTCAGVELDFLRNSANFYGGKVFRGKTPWGRGKGEGGTLDRCGLIETCSKSSRAGDRSTRRPVGGRPAEAPPVVRGSDHGLERADA
jgi:hypothetical protein